MDLSGFAPEEIQVRVTDDNVVARAEKRDHDSYVKVVKSVPLPKGVQKSDVVCRYVDGRLVVQIPQSTERKFIGDKSADKKPTLEPKQDSEVNEKSSAEAIEQQSDFEQSVDSISKIFKSLFGLDITKDDSEEKESRGNEKENRTMDRGRAERIISINIESCKQEEKGTPLKVCEDAEVKKDTECCDREETCLMLKYDEKPRLKHVDKLRLKGEERLRIKDEETLVKGNTHSKNEDAENPDNCRLVKLQESENICTRRNIPIKFENGQVSESSEANVFKFDLNLSQYEPEDVTISYKDGHIMVNAEREVKGDNYSEIEKIQRRVKVPDYVDDSKLKSYLSSEGKVTICAPYYKPRWRTVVRTLED